MSCFFSCYIHLPTASMAFFIVSIDNSIRCYCGGVLGGWSFSACTDIHVRRVIFFFSGPDKYEKEMIK